MILVVLLAATYVLPDAPGPAPDAAQAARLARALASIRSGDDADAGVREIALLGEVALPAVVARLNEAGAGERLLLLAAVSRMDRAAPLLEQARDDAHPAVRAWADRGRPRPRPPLRTLAARYLDGLAYGEE